MNKRNLLLTVLLIMGMCSKGLTVKAQGALRLSISTINTNCADDPNGRATVEATGGIEPYSYHWRNGERTPTIENLVAGGYFVTVTDANGTTSNKYAHIDATNKLALNFNHQPLACANDKNGELAAIPQGGVAPFTYQWADGSTESMLTNLEAGMYMVTVIDANGCRAEEVFMLEEPDPLRIKAHYAHVSCGEESDGYMDVIASGGSGDYTFFWELDGQGGTHREGLKAGLYSVTVTDSNGCEAMICPEIRQSQPPTLSTTIVPETCPGEGDGRGYISPNGDSPPYRFDWPNGESKIGFATNLSPGTYPVTVTNYRNCSAVVDVVIGQAGGGFGFVVETNGITCGNAANGQANVRMTGGVGPFKYEWIRKSDNATVSTAESVSTLTPGEYDVLVTDANGCFGKQDILLVAQELPSITATLLNELVCFGDKTGAASVTANGGAGEYTYIWSNGETGQTIENLAAGIYGVTVTDKNGCEAATTITIKENPEIVIMEDIQDLSCHNTPGGEISVNAIGGSGVYTYAWSNGGTTSSINTILAGTYFLTVTDTDGCQTIKGIDINEPPALNLTTSSTNAADLDAADGSASVTVTGGTMPYRYEWSTGQTTSTINNIPAGSYMVTVTDANGCTETITVVVEATCTLIASIFNTQSASCIGNDGVIVMTISGAKDGVDINWSNGASGSSISGLTPGFYGVTVTDGTGCEYISNTFLADACDCTQPVLEKALVFDATCGERDGSLKIEMSGADNDFNYQWSDPTISGTEGTGLPAGSYQVTITAKTDNACSLVETIHIGNTNIGPVLLLQSNPEICNGEKGSALIVPGNLTFDWSDGGTGGFRNDLAAGTYVVTVTNPFLDDCKDFLTVSIGLESGLSITPTINRRPDCGLSNGSVTIDVEGGSGDYSYSWGAATHNHLPSGTFDIMVTDNISGCSESHLFTLLDNVDGIAVTLDTISNVSCAGRTDGRIVYTITESADFAGPASVSITDGKGKEYMENSLPVGNYCLIIKDANGCFAGEACFEITEPDFLLLNVTVIPMTCSVSNTILLTTSGGNGAYKYDWADQDGPINPRDRRDIENGTYSVSLTDEAGCRIDVDDIAINGECFICALDVVATVDAIPECGLPIGAATIEVANSFGNVTYSWGPDSIRTDLLSGDYTVTITDDFRGCDTTVSFTVPELEIPMEATIAELILCQDETGALQYDLNNFRCFKQPVTGIITDEQGVIYDENTLSAFGNYIFIAMDGDGVEVNRQFFSVENYDSILVTGIVVDEGCTTLGSIDLNLPRAEEDYTIEWADLPQDSQSIDRIDLTEGTYNVTITDHAAGSCSIVQSYVVAKKSEIAGNLAPVALTCDISPVQVNLEGEGLINYEWTPAILVVSGQGTANPFLIPDDSVSTVTVKATNAFGCTVEKEVKIKSVNTNLNDDISSTPQCDGLSITFSNESISSEYYFWDFGDGNTSDEVNPTHTYAEAGDYEVQLRLKPNVPCAMDRGALASQKLSLVEDAQLTADFAIDYDACQNEGQVSFRDMSIINPGTIKSWKWDFGNGMTSTEQNPKITLADDVSLNVSLVIESDIGCNGTKLTEQAFKVFNLPILPTSLQICPGISTPLNPNPMDGATYEWSPAELLDNPNAPNPMATLNSSAEFTVKISQDGCVRNSIIKANVPKEQEFELSEDQEVCEEEEQLIFVDAPENSSIKWTDLERGEVIGSEPELMVAPGTYQVKLTDENDCPVAGVVAIENFAIDATIIDNTDPCDEDSGFLEVVNNGFEDITEYSWIDADGIISAELNENSIEVDPAMTTDYSVLLTNNFGCQLTLTETVVVSSLESMVIIPERDTIFRGESTQINITPGGNYTVSWELSPTLQSMTGFEQVATPEETTTYAVTIVDDATGCSIIQEVTIYVKDIVCGIPNIFFPNAFTPNGDGQNDVLYVRGNALESVYFAIYNRWGEKVFESNSQENGWDGTYKGEMVETDVYGYFLQVTCLSGETYEAQGSVTVIN